MAILKLIKYISPTMRSVFVNGLLYSTMTDAEHLALVVMVSLEISRDASKLPERICIVDAQTGALQSLEGEVY